MKIAQGAARQAGNRAREEGRALPRGHQDLPQRLQGEGRDADAARPAVGRGQEDEPDRRERHAHWYVVSCLMLPAAKSQNSDRGQNLSRTVRLFGGLKVEQNGI